MHRHGERRGAVAQTTPVNRYCVPVIFYGGNGMFQYALLLYERVHQNLRLACT